MVAIKQHTGPLQRVVVNERGRHALWPAGKAIPSNWREVLPPRDMAACREYVRQHWKALDVEPVAVERTMGFGLMFFGGDEGQAARDKYHFLLEAARIADENDFAAVWLPERHFTRMGSLYPNPSVLHAALACRTKRIRLRAGSVVLPLHDPIRVAEEWAVVDNLSGGRVEISFAPGWNTEDFALAPDAYARRYELLYEGIGQVDKLWRGEAIPATDGSGKAIEIRTYPRPVQPKLPIWITSAGSAKSFEQAGAAGVDLLTHLFDQDVDELGEKLRLYRDARQRAGHDPHSGRVAVALHTFVAETMEEVQKHAQGPFCNYLKSNLGLIEKLAQSRGLDLDMSQMAPDQIDGAVAWMYEKFLMQRSLLGTPESCQELVGKLMEIGVQEIACLVDFGLDPQAMLHGLPYLNELRKMFPDAPREREAAI